MVTTKIARGLFYGPFTSRAAAERFEAGLLDLFQIRRCEENLAPSPQHPGCIYGEMNRCLRPCQQAVSVAEYRGETQRVEQFLRTSGESLDRIRRSPRAIAPAPKCNLNKPTACTSAPCASPKFNRLGRRPGLRPRFVCTASPSRRPAITKK